MAKGAMDEAAMRKSIVAIMLDTTLSEPEKALKRQALMAGKWAPPAAAPAAAPDAKGKAKAGSAAAAAPAPAAAAAPGATMFDETLKCAVCMELCERPVTAPCQHNYCLACFTRWTQQRKTSCPTCRAAFPARFADNARVNTALAMAIRMARLGQKAPPKTFARINNDDRPDQAFTTDRAVRNGRANAASGRIFVTCPSDHFGPIPASADPRGQGILVGEQWADRLDCRQWGAHFPHVAGIAGQSGVGAQSVALSGGYEDDHDGGEWFLYTGSGGRDLSGNKRVNSVQSFDQTFDKMNKALQQSCVRGLPVRVVRSHKEKRSRFAPDPDVSPGVRYDGVYTIARAYRRRGAQGMLVCRYIFVRCDNEAAPWVSTEGGDAPDARPWSGELPPEALADLATAEGKVYSAPADPFWGWDGATRTWGWLKPAPPSAKSGASDPSRSPKKLRKKASEHERALREFVCHYKPPKAKKGDPAPPPAALAVETGKDHPHTLCEPLSTPCGHHFCRACLGAWAARCDAARGGAGAARGGMRARRPPLPCPKCKADLADFFEGAQVNVAMEEVIEKLTATAADAKRDAAALEAGSDDEEEEGEAAAPAAPSATGKGKAKAARPAAASAARPAAPPSAAPTPARAPPPPSAADRARADLAAEFPSVPADVVTAVLAEVDGAARDARVLLHKMVATAAADEKRRAKATTAGPAEAKRAKRGE